MKITFKALVLPFVVAAASSAALASPVPLLTGDALTDEMLVVRAAQMAASPSPHAEFMPSQGRPVVPYGYTGDASHDEKVSAWTGRLLKAAPSPSSAAMPAAQAPMTVQPYAATGDALTDERLFAQQAEARRQAAAERRLMAASRGSAQPR